jgi:hypothetical protein
MVAHTGYLIFSRPIIPGKEEIQPVEVEEITDEIS